MTETTDTRAEPRRSFVPEAWRQRSRRLRRRAGPLVPFALGVLAAFLGWLLFNAVAPSPEPLTAKQVSTVVAQAMASATPPPPNASQVYRIIQPSLVLIQTTGGGRRPDGGNVSMQEGANLGLGSGVVISDQGEILTALHVVAGAREIVVTFADGFETRAAIAGAQPENDIAVLQPEETPELLVPAVMGNPSALSVGDDAYAFGNPFGLYGSLSTGVISGLNRTFRAQGGDQTIEDLIQFDTAVNPGNSGGPLLNRFGQVVGIVVGLLNPTQDEFFVGIGFAVPITTAGGAAGAPQY